MPETEGGLVQCPYCNSVHEQEKVPGCREGGSSFSESEKNIPEEESEKVV